MSNSTNSVTGRGSKITMPARRYNRIVLRVTPDVAGLLDVHRVLTPFRALSRAHVVFKWAGGSLEWPSFRRMRCVGKPTDMMLT